MRGLNKTLKRFKTAAGWTKMLNKLIIYGALELSLSSSFIAVIQGRVDREFRSLNAEAQCEQYLKWKGLGGKCVKQR